MRDHKYSFQIVVEKDTFLTPKKRKKPPHTDTSEFIELDSFLSFLLFFQIKWIIVFTSCSLEQQCLLLN